MDDLTRHLAAAREWSAFPRQTSQLRLPRMLSVGQCCPASLKSSHAWSLSDFRLLKKVGEGALSEVYQAQHIQTGTTVAVKLYAKVSLTCFTRRQIEREVDLQSSLRHPHIVQLYGAFEDSNHIVLIEEYASMGNLLKHISRMGSLSEAHIVQNVMQPLLQALQHLHAQGILHRDLKPENLLLAGGILKLADFGTAINVRTERAVSRVGTLDQMAPEVLGCPDRADPQLHKGRDDLAYGTSADVWAVGALAHELLMGASPFARLTQQQMIEAIMTGNATAPSPALSSSAQAFLSACLQRDPAARPSVSDLLGHPWIQGEQGVQSDSRTLLLSQCSIASSVERHSSEESETIVCSLLASPCKGDVSSASPISIVRAIKSVQGQYGRQHGRPHRVGELLPY